MASIKARRDVYALLTPEQRAKEKTEHDKVMQQHKDAGKGYNPHGGSMKAIRIRVACCVQPGVSSKHERAVALSKKS